MPAQQSPGLILVGLLMMAFIFASLCAWIGVIVWVSLGNKLWDRPRFRWVPWGGWSVLGVIALNLGMQFAAGFFLRGLGRRGEIHPRDLLIIVSLISAACLILIPALLRMTSGAGAKALGFWSDRPAVDIGKGLIACLLFAPPVYMFMAALSIRMGRRPHPLETMLNEGLIWKNVVVATVAAVVAAPLMEELLFRGVLLGWLTKVFAGKKHSEVRREKADEDPFAFGESWQRPDAELFEFESPYQPPLTKIEAPTAVIDGEETRLGPFAFWMPNILTSMMFAGLHFQQWPAPIPLFFLSLGLGYLAQKSGNIVASITLHACFNGISTAMMFLAMAFKIKPS